MSFDPLEAQGARPDTTVAALELRSVVCLPLIQVRSGSSEGHPRMSSASESTVGLLYLDSRQAPAEPFRRKIANCSRRWRSRRRTILENARLLEKSGSSCASRTS